MLLAELHGKVHAFSCPECGAEVDPVAAAAIEDALTSYVFGALRSLPPEHGLLPILNEAAPDRFIVSTTDDVTVNPWPFGRVDLIEVAGGRPTSIGVEPDVVVTAPGALVCVEVKLGSKLGADPLQLPKEVLWTLKHADGRPWLLLCVTADSSQPAIASFRAERERLVTGPAVPVPEAVASYFGALRELAPRMAWPAPDEVLASVKWISWRSVGQVLADIVMRTDLKPFHRRHLEDVVELLRSKGLARMPFHGFLVEHESLPPYAPLWSPARAPHHLWSGIDPSELGIFAQGWLTTPPTGAALWSRLEAPTLPEHLECVWREAT